MRGGDANENYKDLLYIRRRFLNTAAIRNAIAQVANAIFQTRLTHIWGEATTACASDSEKFGAWDRNLLTEWHARYDGPGVMIYWHVDKKACCIYSQLESCSSSEVAAMMEGVLRHCTEMSVDRNYVDTHGQSAVAVAFSSCSASSCCRGSKPSIPRTVPAGQRPARCLSEPAAHPDASDQLGAHPRAVLRDGQVRHRFAPWHS
jgi:TnpA family transposase